MAAKPPLDLSVALTDASGTNYTWSANGRAADRPQGISFGSLRGNGFGQGGCTVTRRVDLDYNDIGLYNDIAFIGADGSVAYEGRVAASPRSYGGSGHSISLTLAGWMAHAQDRKFSEIYVDRDLSRWQMSPGYTRQASLLTGDVLTSGQSVSDSALGPAIQLPISGGWSTKYPACEVWYDAGSDLKVAAVWFSTQDAPDVNLADAGWSFLLFVSDDDAASATTVSSDYWTGGVLPSGYFTPATAREFAAMQWSYTVIPDPGPSPDKDYSLFVSPAVYGDSGLTRRGDDPGGFYASDVIRDVASRFAPKLDTSGVQDTTFVIPHLVFDRVYPYDAFLELNKYHLWNLAVWEGKKLHFGPTDLTDYDWQIRLDDPGVTVDFQGDSTQDLANGIVVTYTNVDSGRTEVITPDDDATLADTRVLNPANQHGIKAWTEATLSSPTNPASAVQIGRALLAEFNAPKSPGTYRVTGHIKDRAGHWQQAWKVRAGDTISITSSTSLSDRPHLIVETSYDHDTYTVTIGVDNTLPRVDALLDRMSTALAAANLA